MSRTELVFSGARDGRIAILRGDDGGRISVRYRWRDDERNAYLYPFHFDTLPSAQAHELSEFSAEELLGGQELTRLVSRRPMTRGDDIF